MTDEHRLFQDIRELAERLRTVQAEAERLGLFVGDRDLLSCPDCGLEEDVLCGGSLIVSTATDRATDTGLRFRELDPEAGRFRCPACAGEFLAPEEEAWSERVREG